jgi:cytochrome c oxidase assembly protein subunit 11
MTVMYQLSNNEGRVVKAQAIPSYAPKQATEYFRKIQCFCFTQQTLQAGESKRMPVVFVIDPKLPKDVKTITLSYTFFELNTPAAATAPPPAQTAGAGA